MRRIHVVGTADTKGEELAHLAGLIRALGAAAVVWSLTASPLKYSVSGTTPNTLGD